MALQQARRSLSSAECPLDVPPPLPPPPLPPLAPPPLPLPPAALPAVLSPALGGAGGTFAAAGMIADGLEFDAGTD